MARRLLPELIEAILQEVGYRIRCSLTGRRRLAPASP